MALLKMMSFSPGPRYAQSNPNIEALKSSVGTEYKAK